MGIAPAVPTFHEWVPPVGAEFMVDQWSRESAIVFFVREKTASRSLLVTA